VKLWTQLLEEDGEEESGFCCRTTWPGGREHVAVGSFLLKCVIQTLNVGVLFHSRY